MSIFSINSEIVNLYVTMGLWTCPESI